MPNQFFSPEGDLENYFVTEYWLIDQYVGDELWGWGTQSTGAGSIGNNSIVPASTPVTTFAGGTNWKQVACGVNHTAAIKTDGTLWTWGNNGNGKLGNNITSTIFTPVTTFAGGTNWKQVACGGYHTAAIKTDGTLWTWGNNGQGQLGNNTTTARSTPVTTFAGGTNWKQVSTGGSHTAAIKIDGTLWLWGESGSGRLGNNSTFPISQTPITTFSGGTNWKQVSCGNDFTTAIKTNGTLWTWGLNSAGQLGDNTILDKLTPVTTFAGGTNWKQVSGGGFHTMAVKDDGTLWTWGNNGNGRLGDNTTSNKSTPVTTFAGGNNWKQVSGGRNHSTAIKTNGTLWGWGTPISLGINSGATNRLTPITTFAGGTNWKQVSGGNDYSAAVTSGTTPDLPIS